MKTEEKYQLEKEIKLLKEFLEFERFKLNIKINSKYSAYLIVLSIWLGIIALSIHISNLSWSYLGIDGFVIFVLATTILWVIAYITDWGLVRVDTDRIKKRYNSIVHLIIKKYRIIGIEQRKLDVEIKEIIKSKKIERWI